MRTNTWPIAARIATSALIAIAVSALIIEPILLALFQFYVIHNDYWMRADLMMSNIGIVLMRAPVTAVLGVMLTSPLIAMAIAAGLIFRRSIERHLLLWSLAAPVAVWLFVCLVFASMPGSGSFETRAFPERLWACVTAIDNLLFLFGPMVSGLAFYGMSVTRRAHPSERAAGSGDRTPAA